MTAADNNSWYWKDEDKSSSYFSRTAQGTPEQGVPTHLHKWKVHIGFVYISLSKHDDEDFWP